MGSPASIGQSIMQSMLGYGQLKLGRQQADQRQQQIDVEKQRQDILAQQQQNEDVTHALQQGAKYVGPGGMIQEVMNSMNSDDPGAPGGGQVVIHRPVSKDEYVATYPGPKGSQPVKLAWPASEAQRILDQFHANNQPEMVQARTNQAQATARAQAEGQAEGAAQGRAAARAANATIPYKTNPDTGRIELPDSFLLTPEEASGIAEKQIAPTINGQTREDIQRQKAEAAAALEQQKEEAVNRKTAEQVAQRDFNQKRNQEIQKQIADNRAAVSAGLNPVLGAAKLRDFDSRSADLQVSQANEDQLREKINSVGMLLDPNVVGDGEKFQEPRTGVTFTMSPARRQALQNYLGQLNSQANTWSVITKKRLNDLGINPDRLPSAPQAQSQPQGSGTPAPGAGAAPAATSAPPAGGAGAAQPQASAIPPAGGSAQPMKPEAADAQDILNHRISPSQWQAQLGGRGMQKTARVDRVKSELRKLDPNFNWEDAESSYQLVKSPQFQQTIRYMDYADTTLPNLIKNAQALDNGGIRGVNALLNAGRDQFNSIDLKKFQTDKIEAADAIAKILQGGGSGSGTSDTKLKQAEGIFRDSDSPKAIAVAAGEIQGLLHNRRATLTRGTAMEGQSPAGSLQGGAVPTVSTKADFDKLASGATYINAKDGKTYRKP